MNKTFLEILNRGYRTYYKKPRYIFYRGDIGNDFYIIEKGVVELSIFNLNGDKVILSELKEGDFFGQVEIFTNGVRPTNAYVSAGTQLVSFTAAVVKDFLNKNNEKAIEIIESLCGIIDSGVEKIEDALVLNAYQKVSKKVYELSMDGEVSNIFINQKKMSEFLALSERTTNISLQKLQEKGAISLKRSRIEIIDDKILKKQFLGRKEVA